MATTLILYWTHLKSNVNMHLAASHFIENYWKYPYLEWWLYFIILKIYFINCNLNQTIKSLMALEVSLPWLLANGLEDASVIIKSNM